MEAIELVDKIVPDHSRTTCPESLYKWGDNFYVNETGTPRCVRCLLLAYLDGVPEVQDIHAGDWGIDVRLPIPDWAKRGDFQISTWQQP